MNYATVNTILDTIIHTSNNNITVTDEKGYILYTNPQHWAVYGIELDQYVGKSVYELEAEGILSPSITAMVLNEKKSVEVMQHTITGKVVMATAYPIFNDDGEIILVISYAQDQTEINNLQHQYEQLKRKIESYQTEVKELRGKEGVIYRSKKMEQIKKTLHRVAESDATVLFLGESGVGKSMFARKLHNQSYRKKEPFIEVNCSTIPESLFEAEMFGYEPGSFTGALKQGKQGLIEQAHNGTLFLDEIGELPLAIQVKLLKVLQEKKFTRIGGTKEYHIDFRLAAATNQNLEEMVQKGTFRLDLYYRLSVIPLHIPSLRDRKEDIALLINHYLELINKKYKTNKKLHSSTYEALIQYTWPGNVRELENLIERLILTTDETIIFPNALPSSIIDQSPTSQKEPSLIIEQTMIESYDLKTILEKVEKWTISKAYQQCKSTYKMAAFLGISQPSVIRKLKKYKNQLLP
ncbi:sigma-54 interaction domain-containing protein [Peribacillus asahii]|uniref:sigma-54 interaction domain-containing protein n=1 Tax=Peribacillus asahii TaxID=228899 RepID=UPI00207A83BA|nr:sigma 54-interacting transcriptional regulator [Peribacillus asahii]USK70708.1 sigma 54-interacting transcriptional regulator [Peribacillus asahii]